MDKSALSLTTPNLKLQLVVVTALFIITSQIAPAQTESILYSFCSQANCTDGDHPDATVIFDGAGNLYGTTAFGGASNLCVGGCGTVFKLSPGGTETVLHTFGENATDGQTPVAQLIMDQQGNLYGTTFAGGLYGFGTVFELNPAGIETILHSFRKGGTDGYHPSAGVMMDSLGNLYGTTYRGGAHGLGTVFELRSNGTETILHSFAGHTVGDGARPEASVIRDANGNLYGTTSGGGAYSPCGGFGCGTVFKLSTDGIETILHSFAGHPKDGSFPQGGLLMDARGNLYGTTYFGGANSDGILFEVTHTGTEKVLYNFCSKGGFSCTDGANPVGTLVRDAGGNLYGATAFGGGTVFERSPGGGLRVLHSFGAPPDGSVPFPGAGLIIDGQGNLYGTTAFGGASGVTCTIGYQGCGTVFKVTP